MNFNIFTIPPFDRQIRRLSRKYPSLKADFNLFVNSLKNNPRQGVALSNNCFKIRLAISDKGKGKSGGARIITHVKVSQSAVYLLSIYDKSEQKDIPVSFINELLKYIPWWRKTPGLLWCRIFWCATPMNNYTFIQATKISQRCGLKKEESIVIFVIN